MIKNLIDMFSGLGSSMSFLLPPRDYIVTSPKDDYKNMVSDFNRVNTYIVGRPKKPKTGKKG